MKNFFRYVVPSMLVLLGIIGYAIAAAVNVQTWSNPATGRPVAAVDSNGSFNDSGLLYTYTGGTSANATLSGGTGTTVAITGGTVTVAQPFAGSSYKEIVVGVASFTTTAATVYQFPVAFTNAPQVFNQTSGTGYAMTTGTVGSLTTSTTGLTIGYSNSAATGFIDLKGN